MKKFISGLMCGVLLMCSLPVYAEYISVVVDDTIRLVFDGESKTLPADYRILNYNGYTYLPSRYVAETMGGKVAWDEGSRTISITSPEPKVVEKTVEVPVEVEKIVYVERESTNFRQLPVSETKGGVIITLRNITNIEANAAGPITRIACEIENSNDDPVAIDYSKAVLVVGNKEYKTANTASQDWNSKFVNDDIPANTKSPESGYFVFPLVDKTATDFTLKVSTFNQGTGETTHFEIRFSGTIL